MILKKLRASFGKLSGAELEPGPGLNILTAPNESGKTTWCAFLRAMLYGINTADRDKAGYLADKSRFRPWSGAPMEGSLLLHSGGRDILLERTTTAAGPMKGFSARYPETGEAVPGLTGDTAGEALTGMTEPVFSRTAFISQMGLRVGQNGELEKRITGLVSTGEENTATASEAVLALRGRIRRLRYRKAGRLPELEQEISQITASLETMEALSGQLAEGTGRLAELEKKNAALTEELRQEEVYRRRQRLQDARARVRFAENEAERLDALLTVGGNRLGRNHLAAVRAALAAQTETRRQAEEAEEALTRAEAGLRQAERALSADPLAGKTLSQAEADAAEIRELERRQRQVGLPLLFLCALGTLAGLVPGFLYLMQKNSAPPEVLLKPTLWVWLGLGLTVIAAAVFALLLRNRLHRAGQLRRLLLRFGIADPAALEERLTSYRILLEDKDTETRMALEARAARESAQAARNRAEGAAAAMGRALVPSAVTERELLEGLDHLEALLEESDRARASLRTARELLEQEEQNAPPEEPETPSQPPRSRDEILLELSETRESQSRLLRETGAFRGRLSILGDPVVLRGRLAQAREELAAGEAELSALELASRELEAAGADMQERLSPLLNRQAGEILSRMTGGRYETVTYDKTLSGRVLPPGETVSRSTLSLSTGAGDQVYLALRLAVCTLLDREGREPCPIILDDALATFDDGRLADTLALLEELGKTRQILLFSCQEREAELFRDRPGVTVLHLKR